MRNMSFAMTTEQYRNRSKDVTRRQGWNNLKVGEEFMGIEKGQGLKKGEKVKRLHAGRTLSTRWEPIKAIAPEDVIREGFPGKTTKWFIAMYCRTNKVKPTDLCNRIEFEHLPTVLLPQRINESF